MLNIKIIKKTSVFVIFSATLISCNIFSPPIKKLADQNAVSAIGVNFDTNKLIVLDSATGKTVQPCISQGNKKHAYKPTEEKIEKMHGTENGLEKCTTTLLIYDKDIALKSAIELSRRPIEGKVLVKGKEVDATYVVIVKALYNGSICNTDSSGGNQYETCGRRRR